MGEHHLKIMKQPIGKMPVIKIKSTEVDDKMKVVHHNLLLPLFVNPSDYNQCIRYGIHD